MVLRVVNSGIAATATLTVPSLVMPLTATLYVVPLPGDRGRGPRSDGRARERYVVPAKPVTGSVKTTVKLMSEALVGLSWPAAGGTVSPRGV